MPDGSSIVIDAWDPITQTAMSLAAYSNDALDPEKDNGKRWRDTEDNMRIYLKETKKIPRTERNTGARTNFHFMFISKQSKHIQST